MRPHKQFRYMKLPRPEQKPILGKELHDFASFLAESIAEESWPVEEKMRIGALLAEKWGPIFGLADIGQIMGGLSRERVRQIQEKALGKLSGTSAAFVANSNR